MRGSGFHSYFLLFTFYFSSAVRASGPTTRPAHAFPHFIHADFDATLPGDFLLGRSDPTNPLVSRQRGDIGPEALRSGVRFDGLPEVCWQFMNRAASDFRHTSHITIQPVNHTRSVRQRETRIVGL